MAVIAGLGASSLIGLAGLEDRLPRTMRGAVVESLLPGYRKEAGGRTGADPRPMYADEELDGNVLESLSVGRWKYVRSNPGNPRGLPVEALFDLEDDPAERRNLIHEQPELARRLAERLEAFSGASVKRGPEQVKALDAETEEHLRALGYLH